MSNALAIGAVTAVLKNLLDNAVVNEKLTNVVGPVKVSAMSPDRVKSLNGFIGLNVFLYHVQPNPAWRNAQLPSRDGSGNRVTNPPLALDLYYLISAWGSADFEAEILLGYAMQLFHEVPVLSREVIRKTFEGGGPAVDPLLLPPKYKDLAAAALAEQVELLKITPYSMGAEEGSKLWAAIDVNYRPSVAYQVSVVLIESEAAARSPLPVLVRNIGAFPDTVPPFPTLFAAIPPSQQPAVRPGENLLVTGHHLGGTSTKAILQHSRAAAIEIPLTQVSETQATVPVPANATPGSAAVSVVVSGAVDRVSNTIPVPIAPVIDIAGSSAVRDGAQNLTVKIKTVHDMAPGQVATLILAESTAVTDEHDTPKELTFFLPKAAAPAAGLHFVRLRLDGVESIFIDRSKTPPEFIAGQKLAVP